MRNWKRAIEIAVELEVDLMNSEFSGSKYDPLTSEEKFIKSMDELLPVFEKKALNSIFIHTILSKRTKVRWI